MASIPNLPGVSFFNILVNGLGTLIFLGLLILTAQRFEDHPAAQAVLSIYGS